MSSAPQNAQPQPSTLPAPAHPPVAAAANTCPLCHESFLHQLKYHHRITHQPSTQVVYPGPQGSSTLRRDADGSFHCLYCTYATRDPNKLGAHAPSCPGAPNDVSDSPSSSSQDALSLPIPVSIRNSDYLRLPDENTVMEHPDYNLASYGIVVHKILRAAICVECQRPILPSSLVSHIQMHLKFVDVPCGLSDELSSSFQLNETLGWPKTPIAPVFPIPIHDDPLLFCNACHKGYASLASLHAHQRTRKCSTHLSSSDTYHYGYGQLIHMGKKRSYLEVIIDELLDKTDSQIDHAALFMDNLGGIRDYANVPVRLPEDEMNLSSFYHRDGWLQHLGGYTAVDLSEAYRASTSEDPGGDILRDLAYRYLKHAQENIKVHSGFGLMRALGSVLPFAKTDEERHSLVKVSPASVDKYSLVLHKLVFNFIRFHCGTWTSQYSFPAIDPAQKEAIDRLCSAIESRLEEEKATENPEERSAVVERYRDQLDERYHTLCYKLFAHVRGEYAATKLLDKFFSAVNCFVVIQCIQGSGAVLKSSAMTQILAALMYSVRSSMLQEYAIIKQRDNLTQEQAFEFVKPYLVDQRETPMAFLFNAISLLKRIDSNQVMASDFSFTDASGKEVSYRGHLISVDTLKKMVDGTFDTYYETLKEVAFFGEEFPKELFPDIDIEEIIDNTSNRTPGYCFLQDPRNNFEQYRGAYGKWLLSDPQRADKFTYFNGKKLIWKPHVCENFLRQLEACRDPLLVGLLISAGPASRGTEVGRQRLRESPGCLRNVLILFRNLCIVATEDKTSLKHLQEKYVPHVPTRPWAIALVQYLIFIRDFEEMLVELLYPQDSDVVFRYRTHLWPSLRRAINGDDLSSKLSLVMQKYLGQPYKITFWRKLVTQFAASFKDQYLFEIHKEFYVDTASMHSTVVANGHYRTPASGLPGADTRSIVGCIRVGIEWHKLLNIGQEKPIRVSHMEPEPRIAPAGSGPASFDISEQVIAELSSNVLRSLEPAVAEKLTDVVKQIFAEMLMKFWPKPPIPFGSANLRPVADIMVHPSRRRDLRRFLRDPKAKFSTPEQGVLLEYILEGRESILGILGTGFGKTTLIMMLAKMYAHGKITVVVLPLSALHADLEARARQYGLVASRWSPDPSKFNPNAAIITCAVEYLEFPAFHEYIKTLNNMRRLFRIIFDEVHKLITDLDFRSSFNFFWSLNLVGIPLISFTASFPDHLVREFNILTRTSWRIIRMPSNRKELMYDVMRVDTSKQDLITSAKDYVLERVRSYSPEDRAIVFCRTVAKAKDMAASLGVEPYCAQNRDEQTEDPNVEIMKRWLAGKRCVMVSTSILGCGLDYPSIRDVVHLDIAYSIMDQYQEDSRGGRDGQPCNAVTIIAQNRQPSLTQQRYRVGMDEVYEWATSTDQCYRIIPSRFLDGVAVTCMLLDGAELCAFCTRQELQPPPEHPIDLLPPSHPREDVSRRRIRPDWYEDEPSTAARHTPHVSARNHLAKRPLSPLPPSTPFRPPPGLTTQIPRAAVSTPNVFRPPPHVKPYHVAQAGGHSSQREGTRKSIDRSMPVDDWSSPASSFGIVSSQDPFSSRQSEARNRDRLPEGSSPAPLPKRRRVDNMSSDLGNQVVLNTFEPRFQLTPSPPSPLGKHADDTHAMLDGSESPQNPVRDENETYSTAGPLGNSATNPSTTKLPITPLSDNHPSLPYTGGHLLTNRLPSSSRRMPAGSDAFITPSSNPYSQSAPKHYYQPASSSPDSSLTRPTRLAPASNRANAGLASRMATIESEGRKNEWQNTIVRPLRKLLTFFRGKCISCYIESEARWDDHASDDCKASKSLTGMNLPFKSFRESIKLPRGVCYGCYVDTKNADHPPQLGRKCLDLGTSTRLIFAYTLSANKFPPCPLFDMHSTGFNLVEWLTIITPEVHDNYWLNPEIKRYNMWGFLIWFAGELAIDLT